MNTTLQRYLVSSLTTFLTFFVIALGAELQATGTIEFTSSFLFGVLGIAARAGIKAVVEAMPGITAADKIK